MIQPTTSVTTLRSGEKGTVASIAGDHRLNGLGVRINKTIEVIRRGPLNGPLHIRLGTTDIMMRAVDAACIQVISNDDTRD